MPASSTDSTPPDPTPSDIHETATRIVLGNDSRAQQADTLLDGRLEITSTRGLHGPERLLISAYDQGLSGKVLSLLSREGVAALTAARLFPTAEVHLFELDSYERSRALRTARANEISTVQTHLQSDLPKNDYDWVCLPASQSGDAILCGDLLRQAFHALRPRGKLLAATDNRRDRWLHGRIRDVFGDVTIYRRDRSGIVYIARRQSGKAPPRKRRFVREFSGRLFGQIVELQSRPGVFSHGRVDDGALSLADIVELSRSSRVLDLGCGSGALGVAAALAAPSGFAVLVDSNVRSVEDAHANLARNGALANAAVLLAHDFHGLRDNSFDVVLANPPYYGDYRILELFTRESRRLLDANGVYYCVTKTQERALDICRQSFDQCEAIQRRDYAVIRCRQLK